MAQAKTKLKWCRENADNYEDLFLIPIREGVDSQGFNADGDLDIDNAVAWIKTSYSRARFYHGRGGEGTSRPDAYVAYVRGEHIRERLITEGANTTGDVGHILSTKIMKAYSTVSAAKQAIKAALAKQAATTEVQS